MKKRLSSLLDSLEDTKRQYGKGCATRTEKLLQSLRGWRFPDAESLLRFHDTLLFLRAFPQGPRVATLADKLLRDIPNQVHRLQSSGANMSLFDDEEFAGVGGTVLRNAWTYEIVRWLVRRHGKDVGVAGNLEEQSQRMSSILPGVLPLLEDDSYVEPDTPYARMMESAAGGRARVLLWLVQALERLTIPPLQKTALYDALGIEVTWNPDASASRTFACDPGVPLFCHDSALIQRKQVSLADELRSVGLPLRRLSPRKGAAALDLVRNAVTIRYRELHGTTRGNSRDVYEADAGRGVQIFLWGLSPMWRLPLRAYYAGFTLKNGVPVNYIEAIGLFEWLEIGFNTFYAFREGETAWIYAKILHLLNRISGATCFSVYPYQLGHENEEAIASGAFWFYRKLGFRPGRPDLLKLARKEEATIKKNPKHRTPPRTLRRLAAGHVLYEFGDRPPGAWDTFSTRNILLAVQRHMAENFGGDIGKMRERASQSLVELLGINLSRWSALEKHALSNFACVLSLLPDLRSWEDGEKRQLVRIIRAKAALEEAPYLRLLQEHKRLRAALLGLGSRPIEARP